MPNTPLIEAKGLKKDFGSIHAVQGLSFEVFPGEVLGLLGPNGAGKSTTIRMLTGFLPPTDGTAFINAIDVFDDPIEAKSQFGYLSEGAPNYGDMRVLGFLNFIGEARGLPQNELKAAIERAVSALQLDHVLQQRIETLSKGFQRRVGLAQAILHDPKVLILDEPTDGLDPNQKHEVRSLIHKMAAEKAIIISTHLLEEVEALCTRVIIIDHGRIVADSSPQDLKLRSRHQDAVHIVMAKDLALEVSKTFEALPETRQVTLNVLSDQTSQITVFRPEGKPGLETIHQLIREQGWPIHQISVDSGRLEDVFRSLTTGDRGQEEALS